jgi:hypothetical protein
MKRRQSVPRNAIASGEARLEAVAED